MLHRSVLELSYRRFPRRIPRWVTAQDGTSSFISSRKGFSTSPEKNATTKPGSTGSPPESKGGFSKAVIGSGVVVGALLAAYQAGYLDQYLAKREEKEKQDLGEHVASSHIEETSRSSSAVELPEQKVETRNIFSSAVELPEQKVENHFDPPHPEVSSETPGESHSRVEDKSDVTLEEGPNSVQEKVFPEYSQSNVVSSEHSNEAGISPQLNVGIVESKLTVEPKEEIHDGPMETQPSAAPEEFGTESILPQNLTMEDRPEVESSTDIEAPISLLDAYHLREKADESYLTSFNRKYERLSKETEAFARVEELNEGYLSKDGKLIFDFLQAIHAAEQRQAELDAHAFAEERRALKEKYESQLRDSRARELMRAEEAAILDKELKRERTKAAAAMKSLQEKMEEKLKMELEQKEKESEMKLQKTQELAKAELAAAITSEKAAQIEKMAEANLHINALCMAFYARSEEARKSHSVHKLALGALALEDALSKGLPIQKEIDSLRTYLEGIEKDSLLDLVLSSLPEETRCHGTDTVLELNQKFNGLKGTLRHFSLIPRGGGGILTHSLAYIASWLKVKQVDQSGEGIESVISRVENYLAEGKLAEAASALEEGVKGSQAEEIVGVWVRQARNRAITEQALTVLQSYATCISLT